MGKLLSETAPQKPVRSTSSRAITQDVTQEVVEEDTHYGILRPNGQPRQGIPSPVLFWRLSLPGILDRLAMKFRWRTAERLCRPSLSRSTCQCQEESKLEARRRGRTICPRGEELIDRWTAVSGEVRQWSRFARPWRGARQEGRRSRSRWHRPVGVRRRSPCPQRPTFARVAPQSG
jgi:hypothetical protein